MEIILGSDHAGFDLKMTCKAYLDGKEGYKVRDIGVFTKESADYPPIAHEVARSIQKGEAGIGILICGTGIGMSMVANRYKGIRAALCHNVFTARMSRLHNDANILAIGGRVIGPDLALAMVDAFLETPFEGGRHQGRINQFD
jgi:ribose 5-phosphate isomerase B